MEKFNYYSTIVIVVIIIVGIPKTIDRWRMASKYYGNVSFKLAKNLWIYSLRSAYGFQLYGMIGLHVFTVFGELRWLIKDESYPRWLGLSVILWSWQFIANRVCPPIGIFLSSSNRQAIENKGWFTFNFRQYRLLSFLNPHEHIDPIAFQYHFGDDLRIRWGSGWRVPVFHLTDVAPIVISDVRNYSSSVKEEVTHIVNNRLGAKIHFLIDRELPDWIKTLYKLIDSPPNCIENGNVVNLFNDSTFNEHDIAQRKILQNEYSSLFKDIPQAAVTNLSLKDAQITALTIFDREYRRFILKYKGIELSKLGNQLIEEIPPIFSRMEEDEFLSTNRPLQIAESICLGILEDLDKQSEEWAIFHKASIKTKLGKINRFRRNFKPSLDYLHQAQEILQKLWNSSGEVDHDIVANELGDSFFLEGEVWLLQFLITPTEEKKLEGLRCFREVLKLDQSAGKEDPTVLLRIESLNNSYK